MKKLAFTLLSFSLLGFFGQVIAADAKSDSQNSNMQKSSMQAPKEYKICFSNISAYSKKMSDDQCKHGIQDCYTITTGQKQIKLNDQMTFNMQNHELNKRLGIVVLRGFGTLEGTSAKSNQHFTEKEFFVGQGLTGSGVIHGVFTDSECHGEFEMTAKDGDKNS